MAYTKVVEMLGENLASFLELTKKLLIDWEVNPKQLLHTLQNLRKSDLIGLINGTHEIKTKKTIKIDRSIPFDPKTFLGDGWSIEEQDERAIALTEIDLTEVMFDSTLEKGEKSIKGEDKLKRLKEKTNRIRLDAVIFKTLWENQFRIPLRWKERTNGNVTFILFDGTILKDPNGNRCVLSLYWFGGEWFWNCYHLELDLSAKYRSAVLPTSELLAA
jgi:hypothetical protein